MKKKYLFQNSIYAISDQVFGTGAHFVLHILIARYYSVQEYGEFVFLYTFFIMVRMVHNAIVQEPVSVLQLGGLKDKTVSLTSIYLYSHILIIPTFFLVGVTYFFYHAISLYETLFFLLACLIEMFYWGGRSIIFKNEKPAIASISSFIYLSSIVLIFFISINFVSYNISPFLILAASALASGLIIIFYIKPPFSFSYPDIKDISKKCFQYGKWAIPASLLIWTVNNIYFVLLPLFHDIESSGYLKAVLNILIPFNHLITGASLFLLPMFSRLYKDQEDEKYNKNLNFISLLVFVGSILFGLLIYFYSYEILYFVYGQEYTLYSEALGYTALLLPFLWGITAIIRVGLRSKNKPDKVFYTYALSLFPAGLIIIYFGLLYNVEGSLASMVILQVVILAIIFYLFKNE